MSTKPLQPSPDKDAEPDDGILESIGKAIVDPVESGAEDEEPKQDGRMPIVPGG